MDRSAALTDVSVAVGPPDQEPSPPLPTTLATVATSTGVTASATGAGFADATTSTVPPVQEPSPGPPLTPTPTARAVDLGPVPLPAGTPGRLVIMDADGSIVVLSREPARLLVPASADTPPQPIRGDLDVDAEGVNVYFSRDGTGVLRVPLAGGDVEEIAIAGSSAAVHAARAKITGCCLGFRPATEMATISSTVRGPSSWMQRSTALAFSVTSLCSEA